MDWRQPLEIELIFDEWSHTHYAVTIIWHAAPSKNLEGGGGVSNVVGIICPPFRIGLTDLPKNGGRAIASPVPLTPASLHVEVHLIYVF